MKNFFCVFLSVFLVTSFSVFAMTYDRSQEYQTYLIQNEIINFEHYMQEMNEFTSRLRLSEEYQQEHNQVSIDIPVANDHSMHNFRSEVLSSVPFFFIGLSAGLGTGIFFCGGALILVRYLI